MRHDYQDRVSLELGRRVADQLRTNPEWLDLARGNLDRWSRINSSAPALLRCYAQWRELLARPLEEICELLTADTDEGQVLRQNSPFAGAIPPSSVWEIKRRIRDESISA